MSSLQPPMNSPHGLKLDRFARAKRTSLILPAELPLDAWKHIGEQISIISDASAWWIGDWLAFGRDKYPDRYKQSIRETALDYQTLRNYAWVAGRFEVSRRRDKLSFQHHTEVAALPEDQQDLWLDRAERSGWSRNKLRSHLRSSNGRATAAKELPSPVLQLSVSPERLERWQHAAGTARIDLHEWISGTLDRAACTEPDQALTVPLR
jgi:hypothetical protein